MFAVTILEYLITNLGDDCFVIADWRKELG